MKKKKKKKKLINYIIDKKYHILLENHIYLLEYIKENLNKRKIDHLIRSKNESKKIKLILHKIFSIVKAKNKKNKSYQLLIKFKKYWKKFNTNYSLYKYVDSNRLYLWFAYALNEVLYINIKQNKNNDIFSYRIKENNLYIKLASVLYENLKDILNNYKDKMKKNLLNKITNKKIYFITANRIIKTCLKAKIFYRKTVNFINKKISYLKLNKQIFNNIFKTIIAESIQLPTLNPVIYTDKDDILINKNESYTFNYKSNYLEALNYLNSQKIVINEDYLKYLLNLNHKQLYKFSERKINLHSLKNIKKITNKKIISLIFISTIYIINKYKKHIFYFQYKCDKRGRIYQINWPMNSLYTKILSPLFIFQETLSKKNSIKPNFDTYYWYKSYTLNPNKVLSLRDATNSIFQIAGCLLFDELMLKYSNIHNEDSMYSIYDYILNIYNENIDSFINLIQENYKIINDLLINKIKNIDRKFLKNLIMTWCYNQSYKNSVKKIYEHIFLNNKKKWIINNNEYNNKQTFEIFYEISRKIHKYIFDIFRKHFKIYILLKQLINLIAKILSKMNKNIKIDHKGSNTHCFEQHIFEKFIRKIYIETFFKKKKYLYIYETNKYFSLKDNKRSLAPNIIQYLDSVIAVQVILACKQQNIPIITNHDCFYTTLNNDNNILNIYNNILKRLFIEHNFLEDLLRENNLFNHEITKIQIIHKKINKIRQQNQEKINNIFKHDILYSIHIKNKEYDN